VCNDAHAQHTSWAVRLYIVPGADGGTLTLGFVHLAELCNLGSGEKYYKAILRTVVRRVRKIAKSDCYLRHVLSVHPHGTTRFQLE
jgi:hypothetical protein